MYGLKRGQVGGGLQTMSAGRRMFIGDVQGCADELTEMLSVLQPAADDSLYYVGDLVNRGPSSLEALRIARQTASGIVLGNHEAHLLRRGFFEDRQVAVDSFPMLADLAGADDWEEIGAWIGSWPILINWYRRCTTFYKTLGNTRHTAETSESLSSACPEELR